MRPDGSIPIELLATFNRIQKLTNDYNVILEVKAALASLEYIIELKFIGLTIIDCNPINQI